MRWFHAPARLGLWGAILLSACATPPTAARASGQVHSGGELARRIADGLARAHTVTVEGGDYQYAEWPFHIDFTPHLTAYCAGGQVLIRGRIDLREGRWVGTYDESFVADMVMLVLRQAGWPRFIDAAPSLADAHLELTVRSTQPILVKSAL
ncbi:MAG TPA: hypothetical protein VII38_17185, partial [Polyangia bacterium]